MLKLLAQLSQADPLLFGMILFLVFVALAFYFFYSFIVFHRRGDVSPYSGMPLRSCKELTYSMQDKVNRYLKGLHDFDNRPIDFSQSSFCRETGRIFPNSITWSGAIKLDWSFIQKRYRGHFVSWGSLSLEKKKEILSFHHPLHDFQTEVSSTNPSPRMIDEPIALAKPGPLYVDPDTKILMGWKLVPETELEVLIVQKPISFKLLNLPKQSHEK